MTKITLPPCKFYEGACPKINKKPCNFTNTYECPYYEPFGDFDAVAAAIRELLYLNYEQRGPRSGNIPGKEYSAKISDGGREYVAFESTPTAALVAAALAHNEANGG